MTTTTATDSSSTVWQRYLEKQATDVKNAKDGVSSTGAKKTAADLQEIAGNFDTFIKILTTQLKNQDPTAATDTNQFTQELVQFAGVEQQLATNNKLDKLVASIDASTTAASLDYVGKYVVTSEPSNKIVVQDGRSSFAYSLDADVENVQILIKDSSGNTVATLSGPTGEGMHKVAWDGEKTNGTQATDGTYTLVVKETLADGTSETVNETYMIGKVTSVAIDATNGNKFYVGNIAIDTADIAEVFTNLQT